MVSMADGAQVKVPKVFLGRNGDKNTSSTTCGTGAAGPSLPSSTEQVEDYYFKKSLMIYPAS